MMGLWIFQAWREEQKQPEEILYNVYIENVSGSAVTLVAGDKVSYESQSPVSQSLADNVADVYIQNQKISKIVQKPDYVTGTIQKIGDAEITIDDYGSVELAEGFAVYRMDSDGSVAAGEKADLKVGQTSVRFVAVGNQICAAIVPDVPVEDIRVLLYNSDFSSYDQKKVVLTATSDYTVTQNGNMIRHKKGEKTVFTPEQVSLAVVAADSGKIRIESLKRQYGTPEYRGIIRITKNGEFLQLINELPLEEYLYSVVPSEMPTEYHMEALKAQAVCARSYAVVQMNGNRLAAYGAHVDDSVSFQVYNNQKEDERAISAVDATKNQIAANDESIASTYFYSSSCGSREGTKDVWFTKKDVSYLPAGSEKDGQDLSDETVFRNFLSSNVDSLDAENAWYRWKTEISAEELQASLEEHLPARCQSNSSQIQVKQKDGSYKSETISSVGKIENLEIIKRGRGGVISVMEIQGSKKTIRVYTEYNIRTLFGGTKINYQRKDGKTVNGLSSLPSGYFYVEKKENQFVFTGGGFGHGVGMSQNGANAMGKNGKVWKDILTFYFPGTTVKDRGAVSVNESD
jgi:stage II sporulation protein D